MSACLERLSPFCALQSPFLCSTVEGPSHKLPSSPVQVRAVRHRERGGGVGCGRSDGLYSHQTRQLLVQGGAGGPLCLWSSLPP